eukprot:CAMPEP_0172906850 /NCGR_PEP_ID=MMETSP1075-20121228/177693_1 /TAXON_ID=2916 /ORGANISM="Ceratium fusus, Strain PA161109" /LENGTH=79 /DNA_ID=CAMNT_0013764351 /DNA_START=326 /DNA_END=562 /DNA_ORIENTATION=-
MHDVILLLGNYGIGSTEDEGLDTPQQQRVDVHHAQGLVQKQEKECYASHPRGSWVCQEQGDTTDFVEKFNCAQGKTDEH